MTTRGLKFKYSVGEHVLCFEPDPSKARVLYDAKILEHISSLVKDGLRIPEYHVHFQGWNNSWDRIVNEDFILQDDESNRLLMKKISEMARKYRNNHQRIRKIDEVLRRSLVKKPTLNGDLDTSEEEDDMDVEEDTMSESEGEEQEGEEGEEEEESTRPDDADTSDSFQEDGPAEPVEIEIPDELKDVLNDDNDHIITQHQLVKLPAVPNIVTILEEYVIYFVKNNAQSNCDSVNTTADKCVNVCKEMVDGLRVCFDFLLPLILLYADERHQYENVTSTFVYCPPHIKAFTQSVPPVIKREIESDDCDDSRGHFGEQIRQACDKLPLKKLSPSPVAHSNSDSKSMKNGRICTHTGPREPIVSVKKCDENGYENANVLIKRMTYPVCGSVKLADSDSGVIPRRRVTRQSVSESTQSVKLSGDLLKADWPGDNCPSKIASNKTRVKKHNNHWSHTKIKCGSLKRGVLKRRAGAVTGETIAPLSKYSSFKLSRNARDRVSLPLCRLSTTRRQRLVKNGGKLTNGCVAVSDMSCDGITEEGGPAVIPADPTLPLTRSHRLRKLSGRDTPPPPLLKCNSVSTESNKGSEDTACSTWHLLPVDVLTKQPALPSVIYGSYHLLRLFVKLPDLISQMRLHPTQLVHLLQHIQLFLQYLMKERDRLFPSQSYTSS